MTLMRAVALDHSRPGHLITRTAPKPEPARSEALVRVHAISLNPGDFKRGASEGPDWIPGSDLAGIVEQAAADGLGPAAGTRVVAAVPGGAWAEYAAVPTAWLAEIPPSVTFVQAAALPCAGLTALRALQMGGDLSGRSMLVTGASGGVGHLACQPARELGAVVTGSVRRQERAAVASSAGAETVVAGEDLSAATQFGPFHLIVDGVGGRSLTQALEMLQPGGVCVTYNAAAGSEVTFDVRRFYLRGGATLYGFSLFYELQRRPHGPDLRLLGEMVAAGRLAPHIGLELPWTEIDSAAEQLLGRKVVGKVVCRVMDGKAGA